MSNLRQFLHLTLHQIRLFIKVSKQIDEVEKTNARLKEDLKKNTAGSRGNPKIKFTK